MEHYKDVLIDEIANKYCPFCRHFNDMDTCLLRLVRNNNGLYYCETFEEE